MKPATSTVLACLFLVLAAASEAVANPDIRKFEWTKTDFTKHSVDLGKILGGGTRKDDISAIENPICASLEEAVHIANSEPVTSVSRNRGTCAYATHIMVWHEIVNDGVGNVPIAIPSCPLCNAGVGFYCRARTACPILGRPVSKTW